MMSTPNLGPELSDPSDPDGTECNRRGNPASVYRNETSSGGMETAQGRASVVSHRFGGTRYALTRPDYAAPGGAAAAHPADADEDGADGPEAPAHPDTEAPAHPDTEEATGPVGSADPPATDDGGPGDGR